MSQPCCMFALLLTLLLNAPADKEEAEWKEFSPEKTAIAVSLPGKPKAKTETIETTLGNVERTQYTLEADPNFWFFVNFRGEMRRG